MSESATATTAEAVTDGSNNVPVTAMSYCIPDSSPYSMTSLAIGKNRPTWYNLNKQANDPFWWVVVVDLTNLTVVANVLADGYNVPPGIQQYVNNPQYFLFCLSNCETGAQIPAGALYTLLQQIGGGAQLARLEQVYHQLSSGLIRHYSYILAATMDTTDYPGFEALSFTNDTVLAMAFMPVTVGGQTIYAPIDPFAV